MAFYDDYGFKDYVSVASRRAQAARELAKLSKKGRKISPVVVDGRKIATTFWGVAWCDNLERYGDYANRLPRGRSYVRNGSVVDLQIAPGAVTALVSGSDMYDVKVTVSPVAAAHWNAVCQDCSGAIDSLVELLQGRLSKNVMARLCEQKTGLFPSPKEILFTCSCPDWASMCKHVAAVLYGIGARLDHQPELLFTLRQVDQRDMIATAGTDLAKPRKAAGGKVLDSDDLSGMFGIDLADAAPTPAAARDLKPTPSVAGLTASPKRTKPAEPARRKKPAVTGGVGTGTRSWTLAARQEVSARMTKYWAARRALMKKQKTSRLL